MSCVLLTGCNDRIGVSGEAGTQVLLAPAVYGACSSLETRAVDLDDTALEGNEHYYYNGFLGAPALTTLPVGATVWLTFRKGEPVNLSGDLEDPDNFTWEESDLQAYVVQNVSGYNALYPIQSNETEPGYLEVDPDLAYSTPLYLPDGYFQFRMVSPANKIHKDDLKMQVDNGMYIYANDERYEQTRSKVIKIQANGTGVQRIVLNPMINETARFKISLKPGKNVSKMEMMSQGIEISGLQNSEKEPGGELLFQWSSLNLADTLKMKKGDKYSRTYIREFTKDETSGKITGETYILPTNAMSTNTVLLMSLAINGIPTQYLLTLGQMKYFHGHSYNIDLEVGLDGDIRVMGWANQSWLGDVEFN